MILVPLAVLILAPKSLQGRYNESVNFFICFIVAGLILIASLVFAKLSGTLLSTISQRSYSLYATHAPILYFCDREFFSDAEVLSGKQVLISLFLIIFSTEILYRIVEVPSIKYSRKYLNSRQGNSKTK